MNKAGRVFASALTQGGFAVIGVTSGIAAVSVLGVGAFLPAALLGFAVPNWVLSYRNRAALAEWEARLEPKKIAAITPSFSSTWTDAEAMLVDARRKVGRKSAMWRPLDKLVRAVRRLEKRMIDEPEMRKLWSQNLRRRVPLIAETAARYARLSLFQADENAASLRAAEGLLRRGADTFTRLSKAQVGASDFLRLDVDAEILGENMGADVETLTANAAALHGAHHLKMLSEDVDREMADLFVEAEARLIRIADHVERTPGVPPLTKAYLEDDLPVVLEAADLYADVSALTEDAGHEGLTSGREKLRAALGRMDEVVQDCVAHAITGFDEKAAELG